MWADGSWYEGEFKTNLMSGTGKFYRASNKQIYEGGWKHGLMDGNGYL